MQLACSAAGSPVLHFNSTQRRFVTLTYNDCLIMHVQGSGVGASGMYSSAAELLLCTIAFVCLQEFKEVSRSKPQDTGITLIPNEANLFIWRALLKVWQLHPCPQLRLALLQLQMLQDSGWKADAKPTQHAHNTVLTVAPRYILKKRPTATAAAIQT
jgi:hypothetical protein